MSKYLTWCTWPHFCNLKIWENLSWKLYQPLLTLWSPAGVGDAPYLYISTSPRGLLLSSLLHVTPSQLKLVWKAGPKRPETWVTAGVRDGRRREGEVDEKKKGESGEIGGDKEKSCRMKRTPCWEEERSEERPKRATWERERGDSGCEFMESLERHSVLSSKTHWCLSLRHQRSLSLLG